MLLSIVILVLSCFLAMISVNNALDTVTLITSIFGIFIGLSLFVSSYLNKQDIFNNIFIFGITGLVLFNSYNTSSSVTLSSMIIIIIISSIFSEKYVNYILFCLTMIFMILMVIIGRFSLIPSHTNNIPSGNVIFALIVIIPIAFLTSVYIDQVLKKTIQQQKFQYSQLQEMQTQLISQEQIKTLKIISGGLTHDLNNIFTQIFGNLNLLQINKNITNEGKDQIEEIEQAMQNATNLVNQMLSLVKEKEVQSNIIDINTVIKKTANFVIRGRKSKIKFELTQDLPAIRGDATQISQVIQNLIINADESMTQGKEITITTQIIELGKNNKQHLQEGPFIKIQVKDTGSGIDRENKNKIFDLFYTTKLTGSGIGLTISKKIVENHNGYINFEDNDPIGTIFYVLLPITDDLTQQQISEEKQIEYTEEKPFIFIYDDNEDLLKIIEKLFEKLNIVTITASTSKYALEKLEELVNERHLPDIFILDLILPGDIGGDEIMKTFKQKLPHSYYVLSTGFSDNISFSEHLKNGFNSILKKPYTITNLKEMLNNFHKWKNE